MIWWVACRDEESRSLLGRDRLIGSIALGSADQVAWYDPVQPWCLHRPRARGPALPVRAGTAGGTADLDRIFERSWRLFTVVKPNAAAEEEAWQFRESNWDCTIHFLGLWDTVKTYGGLYPVVLPHLRHNPGVTHVRHALALHERRALFSATGVHDDIGSRPVALRWMLGEAAAVPSPLILNDQGRAIRAAPDEALRARQHRPVSRPPNGFQHAAPRTAAAHCSLDRAHRCYR